MKKFTLLLFFAALISNSALADVKRGVYTPDGSYIPYAQRNNYINPQPAVPPIYYRNYQNPCGR